jgi:hypothetical protein
LHAGLHGKAPPFSSIIVDRWKLIHQTDDDTLELYNPDYDPNRFSGGIRKFEVWGDKQ